MAEPGVLLHEAIAAPSRSAATVACVRVSIILFYIVIVLGLANKRSARRNEAADLSGESLRLVEIHEVAAVGEFDEACVGQSIREHS